ncbi:MAG TPA: threonine synthase, partial [Candidatus Limnocylindria bacterium]|nr:threonine synthase [Candidatus Limnocylindria bacterium]
MRDAWREHGYLLDAHAAAAWHAMKAAVPPGRMRAVLATASPFKFPRAAFTVLGLPQPERDDALPERLGEALGLPVPPALSGVWDKPVLRGEVIPKERLAADAMARARAWR